MISLNQVYRRQITDRINFCYPTTYDKNDALKIKRKVMIRDKFIATEADHEYHNEELETEIDILEDILGLKEARKKRERDVNAPPKEISI